jgi:ribulose-phosphate 3-epimerase
MIEANDLSTRIEVDGGVKLNNIKAVSDAGADTFVIGSDFFGADDYAARATAFREALVG